ncbi:MAG: metalloregulator ArsR/SmtB family transcription factor [Eubacteriales bacterium]
MPKYDKEIIITSEIFKALGHPTRMCIINKLTHSELNVTQMQDCLDASQSSISQHLAILKNKNIIVGQRIGSEIIYSLADNRMKDLIKIFLNE